MATYAVGDLQGCLTPLLHLLRQVDFDEDNDHLWLTGDLINRGPESLASLRYVYQHRHCMTSVLGNHDLHLLAVANGFRPAGKGDTLDAILAADDCAELLDWLRHCPLLHSDNQLGFTLVHAGIPPQWSLQQAQAHARELETVLRGDQYGDFLQTMYGNSPTMWSDALTGADRWRAITNYFTRMRYCTADGELELLSKEGPAKPPAGFAPWFSHHNRQTRNERIVFGHWAALEGKADTANVYALDTGCVWGGKLTMMRLDDQQLFSCQC